MSREITKALHKCSTCQKEKHNSMFGVNKRRGKIEVKYRCRDCEKSLYKTWRKKNPERASQQCRRSNMITKYGITEDIFNKIL
jgi:DNA-directed RNA polymerase subunit RPC12/RpoP